MNTEQLYKKVLQVTNYRCLQEETGMGIMAAEIENNLKVFKNLLNCTGKFYFSQYNSRHELVETTSPSVTLNMLFDITGCKAYMIEYSKTHSEPVVLWADVGVIWMVAFEQDDVGELMCSHVIGPVRCVETSQETIMKEMRKLDITISTNRKLKGLLMDLPFISTISFFSYLLMLHRCVTGDNIDKSTIRFQKEESAEMFLKAFNFNSYKSTKNNHRYQTWMAEQRLLCNVLEGNLNYRSELDEVSSYETGVRITVGSALERSKVSVITFITLCVRAAIEGGLSPEVAYRLGDAYLERVVVDARSLGELKGINHKMYGDFIQRVHNCKKDTQYSRQIQNCCDYIKMNVEEPLSIDLLAKTVGYTEYYLSRKFRAETGIGIIDYIKTARMERAKTLLRASTYGIQEISDRLHFCSRSYFSDIFRKKEGITPVKYREKTYRL